MKPNDLAALMKIDFQAGHIHLGKNRFLLFSTDGLGFLRKDLINTLGDEITKGVLFRLGYQAGYIEAINLAKDFSWENDQERLQAVCDLHTIKGLAQPVDINIDIAPDKKHIYMEGKWLDSFEVEQHLKHFGLEKHGVCWTLEGLVSGYASAVIGHTALCLETACRGKGDPACSWQVKPAADWGRTGKEMSDFLRSIDIRGRIDLLEQIVDEKTRALKETHEYLLRAEKLVAIGQISAKIAHEIRNPLTVVGGFANLIQRRTRLKMPEKKYVEIIISEVGRLERFLNDVLTYSTEFPIERRQLNINKLIIDVLLLFEDTFAKSGIAVHQYLEEDMPLVLGDKKKLEEVFIHLFSNAVSAMPKGGHLRIITSHVADPPPSRLRIEIADSGVGIPADVLDRIFEPFFTTKTISSGLGLTVSREILKRHNGTIKILSEVGKGTTVIVELIL
ncbi:MAG: ATP-binding protein [Thermodesulfobacteriota bacterium]